MNNKNELLISVVIPIYNAESTLFEALNSLKNQTYTLFEAILIDDGSSDSSQDICREFVWSDSRFKYYQQTNQGVSAARNFGLEKRNGSYVTFLDSDDKLMPDYLSSLMNYAVKVDADIVISHVTKVSASEQDMDKISLIKTKEALKKLHMMKIQGYVWGKLFKSELFSEVKFPPAVKMCEDMVVFTQLICKASRIVTCNNEGYCYCDNPSSATKRKWNPAIWTLLDAVKLIKEITVQNFPDLVEYANKTCCYGYLSLSYKLAVNDKLTKETYCLLKKNVQEYVTKEAMLILGKKKKMEFQLFMSSRIGYILFRKVYELIRR